MNDLFKASKDEDFKKSLQVAIGEYTGAVAAEKAASSSHDALLKSLTSGEGESTLIGEIVKQAQLKDALVCPKPADEQNPCEAKSALYLKVHFKGGGTYTKKNLWTFFGSVPFKASGGLVASYWLVDPKGNVTKSGSVSHLKGYKSVEDIGDPE